MSQPEPNEEELRAALEEQMRHIRVEDVLVQTLVTLINLGARRLGLTGPPEEAGEKDVEQARLAIEGARALAGLVPQEGLQPVRDALAQLQMAYVKETGGTGNGERGDTAPASESAEDKDAAARAEARSKLWTPPGT
jgi:hypothetical protein